MKLIRLEHLDLVVNDIGKSVEFYRKLGLHPQGTLDGGDTVFLSNGDQESSVKVEMHQAKPGREAGLSHVAFEVADVTAAYKEALFLGGIDLPVEPFEQPRSGRTIINFYDPDGLDIQLARQTSRGEFEDWR